MDARRYREREEEVHPKAPGVAPAALHSAVSRVLALQSSAGNRAVATMLSARTVSRFDDREDRRQERTDERREERTRREDGRDERERRAEGGDGSGGHLTSDWAGRAILERYLLGEGDWDIVDNPSWNDYMKNSQVLRGQLSPLLETRIRDECGRGTEGEFTIDETFPAEIENGEGIVGYQYLHGTNANVGGFHVHGTGRIERTYGQTEADGTDVPESCAVTLDVAYTWNDMIDPNPQYDTDTWKSMFAELITLGQAESYRMSITWHEPLTATVDAAGATQLSGYPSSN
jgi:hypothetical protein